MEKIEAEILESLIEYSSEGILVTDENFCVVYLNTAAQLLLDYKTKPFTNLLSIFPFDKIKINEKTKIDFNQKVLTVTILPTRLENKQVKLCYLSDITHQEHLEEQILCLNTIIDSVDEGIIASDSTGKIILYNNQFSKFESTPKEQVIGRYLREIYTSNQHETVLNSKEPILLSYKKYSTTTGKDFEGIGKTIPVIKDNKVIAVFSNVRIINTLRQLFFKTLEFQEQMHSIKHKNSNGTRFTLTDIIGESDILKNTIHQARKASQNLSPVLLYGETGTGKELFAQGIHNSSQNSVEPFVAINCAAIPEALLESMLFGTVKGAFTGAENLKGLFEQAGAGTLFLDEINSMPLSLQAKLLRVLQEKVIRRIGGTSELPVKCRILSSSNEDPLECVTKGTMRKDLFYRLAVICINIPALNSRKEDIETLADFFLQKYARIYGKMNIKLSDSYREALLRHSWPGNIRELEHTLEGSVAMLDENEDKLSTHLIPDHLKHKQIDPQSMTLTFADDIHTLAGILRNVEKDVLINNLQKYNWHITRAAESLGIGRQNMQYRMRKLGIVRPVK